MGMVYGKAAFNAFLEILPIGILLSSKEKGSFSERSFPQNILFCTIAFAETKSPTASRERKLSLAVLQGLGADPAKHLVISSLSAWFLA